MSERPRLNVAVLIERRRQPNAWEAWGFRIADVVLDDGGFGTEARLLRDDGRSAQFLHPGFSVDVVSRRGGGLLPQPQRGPPVWFVMWRIDDEDPSRAWPERVTLSYNEAGRLLDAQERVDNVPLPTDVAAWLQAYTDEHYRPEPKQRRARRRSARPSSVDRWPKSSADDGFLTRWSRRKVSVRKARRCRRAPPPAAQPPAAPSGRARAGPRQRNASEAVAAEAAPSAPPLPRRRRSTRSRS